MIKRKQVRLNMYNLLTKNYSSNAYAAAYAYDAYAYAANAAYAAYAAAYAADDAYAAAYKVASRIQIVYQINKNTTDTLKEGIKDGQ